MAAIKIDKLLDKEDTTIEDFFYQENFLSEQKQVNKKFAQYIMKKPEKIKTLIDYCYLQNVGQLLENQEKASIKKKIEDIKEKQEKDEKENNNSENKSNSEQLSSSGQKEENSEILDKSEKKDEQEQEEENAEQNFDHIKADKVTKMENKYPFYASEILNEDSIPQLASFLFGKYDPYSPDSESNSVIEKFSNKEDEEEEEIAEDINQSEDDEQAKKEKKEKEEQEKIDKEEKEKRLEEFRKTGEEILEQIFAFLDKDPASTEHYETCAIYFSKIVINLINENNEVFNYLETHPEIFEKLQKRISNKSIAEVLARTISKDITQKNNNYLQTKINMTKKLFSLFKTIEASDIEALENLVLILMELIQCIVNYKNQPNTVCLDELEQIFYEKDNLDILFNKLIQNSDNSEIVTQILEIIQQIFTSFTSLNNDKEDQNLYGNYDHDDDEVVVDDQEYNDKFPFQYFAQKIKVISDLISINQIKKRGVKISNSIKHEKLSIGEGNYHLIEFLLQALKSKEESIQDAIQQSNLFKNTFEIFRYFPLNSLTQTLFDKIFSTVLKLEKPQIIKAFFEQTNLISYMFNNYEQKQTFGAQQNSKFKMNLGQKGFFNKFIDQIKDDLSKNETLKEIINNNCKADWDDLQELVKNDKTLPPQNYEWGQIFDRLHPDQANRYNDNSDDDDSEGRYSSSKGKSIYENFMRSDNPNFLKNTSHNKSFFDSSSSEEDNSEHHINEEKQNNQNDNQSKNNDNNNNDNDNNNNFEANQDTIVKEDVIQRFTADNIESLAEQNQISENLKSQSIPEQIRQQLQQDDDEEEEKEEEKNLENKEQNNQNQLFSENFHYFELEQDKAKHEYLFEGNWLK